MDIDRNQLLELVPHYVVLIVLVFLALALVEMAVGQPLGLWIELAIIFVIALAYRPVVVRLGVAPSAWEQDRSVEERNVEERR